MIGSRNARALSFAVLAAALTCSACQVAESLFRAPDRSGFMVGGKQGGRWIYRYGPGGPKKAEGEYRNDKQIGPWTYWYENGSVEWQGTFDEQRINGPTLFGYDNGQRKAVGTFADGFEEDLWSFWTPEGALDQEGDLARGRPVLRWSYYHPDGSVAAQGFRRDGERIGLWQFYSESGELSERNFPLPEGVAVVHQAWEDESVPRREGFLVGGRPEGRWVTWHPNGRRRLTGDFAQGRLSGLCLLWNDNGDRVAVGRTEAGQPVGPWTVWRDGAAQRVDAQRITAAQGSPESWSKRGSPTGTEVEQAVSAWLAEASAPIRDEDIVDQSPDPDTPSPPDASVARTESTPSIPLRAQPWTETERENHEYLVQRYAKGEKAAQPPRNSPYGKRRGKTSSAPTAPDPALSSRFLGTKLPWTRFRQTDGKIVDLDQFRGKSKVVLVVLRGMAREVCIYCVTQTEALCDSVDQFRALNSEVFVVYPGERNRLEAFLEAFNSASQRTGEPPLGVLYDPDMQLVDRMGIASELAIPSTFVIDEQGTIRYAYVGRDIEDRPPAEALLEALRGLGAPSASR
jgi:antitoxin component YwqK of YwqJK toxin-antitoxin module/peroxiredoxin